MRCCGRGSLPLSVCAAAFLAARLARADAGTEDSVRARADAEFTEGKQMLDSGQIAAACAKFAHSQELDPKLGRLLNLAFCHEQEGKTASAWAEYNGAAALAEQKGQPERVAFAREHATAIAKKLSFLHLGVPSNASVVELDGSALPRDKWTMPLPLDPGEHRVLVTAPGKKPASVTAAVGALPGIQEVPIGLLEDDGSAQKAGAASAGDTPEASPSDGADAPVLSRPSRLPAFIAGGVAAAGLGVGIVAGMEAISKKNAADQDCQSKLCTPQGSALIADARTAATLSTVGFAVAIVGAGAAVWLFVRPPGRGAVAQISPLVGPKTAGLGVEGAW